ncbi:glycosyl transferase [Acrocarpospora corrugata]|uniref:Glycosyl transferase n=1 Tax=Acrocarpospora corrugata TaxID=35763 RepID=A0A5M3W2K5_9ACTN|nr:glycosyltransferase [Acrocarpospora corrugata]GES01371.1 glycosyl transferase [Acrocarpospora corrugata]
MRILHVNKFLYRRGGAESYMLDLAELQALRGDQVAFFGMAHPENIPTGYDRHFPKFIDMNPMPRGPISQARGVGRMMWSTSARRGMTRLIQEFQPDVAHLHNIYHQLSPSVVAALRDAGVPMVMTLHDYKLACPSYSFLDHGQICTACVDGGLGEPIRRRCKDNSLAASLALATETWLHRRFGAYDPVSVFISPSKFLAKQLTRAGIYPDRLQVLDNFGDPASTAAKTEPGGPLVYAGRLHQGKGVDTAIRAVGLLGAQGRLIIAGDGPERAALEALAEQVAPGRITFVGRLPRAEVLDLMRSATALVLPSRWYENQPMTILEAFSCGVPVIGTSMGGIPELVTDGATGRLITADVPMELASAALALLRDPMNAMAMGQAARSLAIQRFVPEGHTNRLREFYAEATRQTRKSRESRKAS